MKTISIIFLFYCSNLRGLTADWDDPLIIYEDSGILMNDKTGQSTINQRAKSVLCGTSKGLQGCNVNERCCSTRSYNTTQVIQDFTVAFKKISKSSASRLSKVATTLNHLIFDIKDMFVKADELLSRQNLTKGIRKTFQIFGEIVKNQTESIGIVSGEIVNLLIIIQSDLQTITEARNVEDKNVAACDLGNHIVALMDAAASLTEIICGVSTSVTEDVCQGIHTLTLVTSVVLFFVEETLSAIADQANKVGFRNDIASTILPYVSIAVKQYILIVKTISECASDEAGTQYLKDILPTVTSSLCTTTTTFTDNISGLTGFVKKYPVPITATTVIDCIIDCIRASKYLKEAETAITETIYSLYDICITILAARLSCSCIDGFIGNIDVSIRKVLKYLHAIIVIIVNIDDDIFSSSNSLLMHLITLDAAVAKVADSIDELIHSILGIGEITDGCSSLISAFEAVVDVAGRVIECVAYMFTNLKHGSHLVNLQESLPHIMRNVKERIEEARKRLSEKLNTVDDKSCNSDIYVEASSIILSYVEFRYNMVDVVCALHDGKENDSVEDAQIWQVDKFVGKLKSSADLFSHDSIGSVIASSVNEIIDEVYDTLIQLSSVGLEKREVLQIVCFILSNFYYGLVTLTSIFNCCESGIDASVF